MMMMMIDQMMLPPLGISSTTTFSAAEPIWPKFQEARMPRARGGKHEYDLQAIALDHHRRSASQVGLIFRLPRQLAVLLA